MYVDTQVRPQGEQIAAVAPTKMKLSEAIRIGARLRPQCKGKYFDGETSCALGAAYEAIHGRPPVMIAGSSTRDPRSGEMLGNGLAKAFVAAERFEHPIFMRNDSGWTREQIADWLAAQGF